MADEQKADGKRRLPVLQTRDDPPPPEEERPPWRWVAIGATATFLVWLPLILLVDLVARRPAVSDGAPPPATEALALVAAHTVVFVVAAGLGGLLVGRLGGKAGRKEATLSGVAAGTLAWLIAASQGVPGGALVWGLMLLLLAGLGALGGLVGGRLGLRWRDRARPA